MFDGASWRATAMARTRCGRPARVAAIIREQEFPGPTSMKTRTPSRYADSSTAGKSSVFNKPAVMDSAALALLAVYGRAQAPLNTCKPGIVAAGNVCSLR